MTDLKPGMKGTYNDQPACLLGVDGEWLWIVTDDGNRFSITSGFFTPDPEPPSTVMVKMDVEDALQFVHITGICDGTCGHSHCAAARPVRDALTKAGLA